MSALGPGFKGKRGKFSFEQVLSGRTRENHLKFHQGRFGLDIRKNSFPEEWLNIGTDTPGKGWSPWRSQKMSGCATYPRLKYGNYLALWVCKTRPRQEFKHNFSFCSFHPVQTQVKALEKKISSASLYISKWNTLKGSHIYLQLKYHLLVCEQHCRVIRIWG